MLDVEVVCEKWTAINCWFETHQYLQRHYSLV